MKRIIYTLIALCTCLNLWAGARLTPHHNVAEGTYNFWLYLPDNYDSSRESTPLIIFLHGASLCGKNLNSVKRYGLIDAAEDGRKIDAMIIAPQCPGGGWKPEKVHATVEWVRQNYPFNYDKVYVVGMSLGGYGTVDYCATYPNEVAAAIAMCGGGSVSVSRQQNLAKLPFWLIHGTADRAVGIKESKKVEANILSAPEGGDRLRTTWLPGGNHGAPARVLYHKDTFTWLFSHSISDSGRPVNRDIDFSMAKLRGAYNSLPKGVVAVSNASIGSIKKISDSEFDSDEFDAANFENITYDDIDHDAAEFIPAGFDDDESTTGRNSILNKQGLRKITAKSTSEENEIKKEKSSIQKTRTATVRKGDTLSKIAQRHGTTVERICRANGISQNATLQIGQRLKLK